MFKLISINFPNDLIEIDQSAFENCENLQSVSVGNCIKYISKFVFKNCKNLKSFSIPNSVEYIDNYAFLGCNSLKDVENGQSVVTIGDYAFSECNSLQNIEIGQNVVTIGDYAFSECSNLEKINCGENVTIIGMYAFNDCKNLSHINLGQNLLTIEEYAFYYCRNLKNLIIPNSVKKIGVCAFSNCENLVSVTIGISVETIGDWAFENCFSLYHIINNSSLSLEFNSWTNGGLAFYAKIIENYDGNIEYINDGKEYFIVDNYLFTKQNDTYQLIEYIGSEETITLPSDVDGNRYTIYRMRGVKNVIIPDTFTKIDDQAFYESTLENIIIPEGVTSIGWGAFSRSKISSIELPNSLISIDGQAFSYTSLSSINLSNNITTIKSGAFGSCNNLTQIRIPDSVSSLGSELFKNCKNLSTVILPKNITAIFYETFYGCSNLKSITIPNNVTFIQQNAFAYSGLTSIIIPNNVNELYYDVFANCKSLKEVKLSENLENIGLRDFQNCISLEEIIIPSSVKTIAAYAFNGCTSLRSVTISNGVNTIGDGAFSNCVNLLSLTIPDSVENISYNAFSGSALEEMTLYNNSNLIIIDGVVYNKDKTQILCILPTIKEIVIPNTVTTLSLNGNTVIEHISFEEGSGLTEINNMAFDGCTNLKTIELPSSIKSIGSYAFGFTNLYTITLPSSVTYIGQYAFYNCSNLQSIIIPESVSFIGNAAFYGCSNLSSFVIPNNVNSLSLGLFNYCTNLSSITLHEGITSIGSEVFANCTSLSKIDLPNSITNIDTSAFLNCSSLNCIAIPNKVTKINANTFNSCTNLYSITLGDNVEIIDQYAFTNCKQLKIITIPNTVNTIGNGAFNNCNNLTTIINNSDLNIEIGSSSYGMIALNAIKLVTKDGEVHYIDNGDNHIENKDDFYFVEVDGQYILRAYLGNDEIVTLPDSVNGQAYSIYHLQGVTNVIISEGITKISEQAFYDCESLISIILPSSLKSIGDYAFYNCKNLSSIAFPTGLEFIGSDSFAYCTSLKNIIISENVSEIGDGAFRECHNLESISLPATIKKIGNSAFSYCYNLKSFIIPTGIEEISYWMFAGCACLNNINIPDNIKTILPYAFDGCTSLTSIKIPSSVDYIGDEAFENCSNLTTIDLPTTLEKIGNNAFYNTAFYNQNSNWKNGILTIGNYLVKVGNMVSKIDISSFNETVPTDAFNDCFYLKEITINGSYYNMLYSLKNLKTINIIGELNYKIIDYLNTLPLTLKVINFKDTFYTIDRDRLLNISEVSIFVDEYKENLMWDHDAPNWNNGNKVYYKGEWIQADFYDENGEWLDTQYRTTSQVIQQPYVSSTIGKEYSTIFAGWDTNGDGITDAIPATSKSNITAKAIMKTVKTEYLVKFLDSDGTVIYSNTYNYNDEIIVPDNPSKVGYEFIGWSNYSDGLTVTDNMTFSAQYSHLNGGHNYEYTLVEPTCTHEGYDLYTCSICGASYKENILDKLDHTLSDWIIEKEATCEDDGLQYRTCNNCSYREEEVIDALGHNYMGQVTKEATCTSQGEITYTCSNCFDAKKETVETVSHKYQKVYVRKFWIDILIEQLARAFFGYEDDKAYYYKCSHCGQIMTNEESASVMDASTQSNDCDHVLGDWIEIIEQNCIDDGLMGRYCSLCKELVEAKTVEPTGVHTEGENVIENKIEATCLENGSYDEVIYCTICGQELSRNNKVINELGHDWEKPSYNWSNDNSNVTATRICSRDNGHIECETVNTQSVITQAYTCLQGELTTYTATFTNNAFTAQKKENIKTANALGHDYQFSSIEWNDFTAKSIYICSHDALHTEEHECIITNEITTVSTCIATGIRTYTATYDGHTSTKEEVLAIDSNNHDLIRHDAQAATCTESGWSAYDTCSRCDYSTYKEIKALGHNYGEVSYVWSKDYYTCTATRICLNDATHTEVETVNSVKEVTQQKSCEMDELSTFTATFTNTAFTTQVNENVDTVLAIGHDYQFSSIDWTDFTAKAIYICSHDSSHIEEHECTISSEVTKMANCTETGIRTYTATYDGHTSTKEEILTIDPNYHDLIHHDAQAATCIEMGWSAYDTCSRCDYSTYKEIKALGHNYGEVSYVWSKDYSACTATRICSRDNTHIESETVNSVKEVTQHKSCELDELSTFTATFTNSAFLTQVKENIVTDSHIVHDYQFDSIIWDNYTAKAIYIDILDNSHTQSYDCLVTSEVTKMANCTETGIRTYTATYDGHTSTKEEVLTIDPNNHDLIHHDAKDATCTESGWNAYDTCSRCSYSTYKEIKALGHDYQFSSIVWTDFTAKANYICSHDSSHIEEHECIITNEMTTVPTCIATGIKTYTATYDGHTSTKEEVLAIDPNNHDLIHHDAKDATCTESGWSAYDTCSRCSYSTYQEIKALGHDYKFNSIDWTDFTAKAIYICSHDASHTKVYICSISSEVTQEATCIETGIRTYTASYDGHISTKEETLAINSNNHDLIHHDGKDASCTESGWNAYDTCSRCSYSTYKEIKALGHNYGEVSYVWSKDYSTCTATRICSRDNTHIESETVNSVKEVTQQKSETQNELSTFTATFTNSAFLTQVKENIVTDSRIVHDYQFDSITWDNYTAKAIYIDSLDNSYTQSYDCLVTSEVTKVANCTETGVRTYTASYDGHTSTKEEVLAIDPNNHDLIHHDAKDASCTESGWLAYDSCSRCNYSTYIEINPIGHDYTFSHIEWYEDYTANAIYVCSHDNTHKETYKCDVSRVVSKESTCTETGIYTYTALYDGHSSTKDEVKTIDPNNHDLIHHDAKDATCTEIGWLAYDTCSRCSYSTYKEIKALGHAYRFSSISWSNETAQAIYVCAHDASHTESYDCVMTITVIKEANCKETGSESVTATYDGYSATCEIELPIDLNNHDLIHHEACEPTCEDWGYYAYDTCSRCNYTTYVEIDALGHEYGEWTRVSEPTLTTKGIEERVCSRCGEKDIRYIDKLVDSNIAIFNESFNTISENDSVEERYSKLLKTINDYNNVIDKESVQDNYQELKAYIESYNNSVNSINNNQDNILQNSIMVLINNMIRLDMMLACAYIINKGGRI